MSPADPISTGASERTFASAAYIAEVSREGQLAQLQEIDGLDKKASSLIGFAGVILGLLFTSSFASQHLSLGLSIGAGLLTAAVLPRGYALLPRDYKFNPNPAALDERPSRDRVQRDASQAQVAGDPDGHRDDRGRRVLTTTHRRWRSRRPSSSSS